MVVSTLPGHPCVMDVSPVGRKAEGGPEDSQGEDLGWPAEPVMHLELSPL